MEHIDFKIEVSGCGVSDSVSGSVVSDSVISGTGDLGFSGNSEGVSGSVANSYTGRYVLGSGDNESVPAVSGVLGNNVVLGSRDGVEADSDVSGRFCCYLCTETSLKRFGLNHHIKRKHEGQSVIAKEDVHNSICLEGDCNFSCFHVAELKDHLFNAHSIAFVDHCDLFPTLLLVPRFGSSYEMRPLVRLGKSGSRSGGGAS